MFANNGSKRGLSNQSENRMKSLCWWQRTEQSKNCMMFIIKNQKGWRESVSVSRLNLSTLRQPSDLSCHSIRRKALSFFNNTYIFMSKVLTEQALLVSNLKGNEVIEFKNNSYFLSNFRLKKNSCWPHTNWDSKCAAGLNDVGKRNFSGKKNFHL